MDTGENEKIELNVPENCSKCGKGAFYRKPDKGSWRCYFCDPPPVVRRMQEHLSNKE